ncbi:hypothetical protein Tco_0500616 [Tanacetum coccineum]
MLQTETYQTNNSIMLTSDELTAMASEHSQSGPTRHDYTPVTIQFRTRANPPSSTLVPPSRSDWIWLFNQCLDEPLNPHLFDQDAPSPSHSPTTQETQTPIISHDDEEDNHDIEVAHMDNDPYFGIPIPEVNSDQSSSSDVIHTIVPPDHQASVVGRKVIRQEEGSIFEGIPSLRLQVLEANTNFLAFAAHMNMVVLSNGCERLQDYRFLKVPEAILHKPSKYALESLQKYGLNLVTPVETHGEKSKLYEDKEGESCSDHRKALKCDADHAGCQDTRRSTSGSIQLLGDRLVSWSSKRQKSDAISILWMRSQLTDYGFGFNKIPMYCDNKSVIALCCNTFKKQADPIQCTVHVENGVIFTKALGRERIEFLINKLGMRSFTPETLKKLADDVDE